MATRNIPVEDENYDESEEEGAGAPPPTEPETLTDLILQQTPWWVISLMFHAAILGLTMLIVIYAEQPKPEIMVVAPDPPPVEEPEIEQRELQPAERYVEDTTAVDEPIFREVEVSDHNESDDEMDMQMMSGENTDAVSDRPFEGVGVNDAIGVGGGGGGRFGHRGGGRQELVARGGGSPTTEQAVLMGLKWLARHQNDDGSWSFASYTTRCGRVTGFSGDCSPNGLWSGLNVTEHNFDVGVTGLSLLAFLGAGYTHLSRDQWDGIRVGDVVRNAIQNLMGVQDAEGCIGPRTVDGYMYNHTVAALALCEAFGLTTSSRFQDAAQRGVNFVVAAQNPGRGWRYSFRAGDNDSSVTGWAVMVLKSAEMAGLTFDPVAYEGAMAWYESVLYQHTLEGSTGGGVWKAGYQTGEELPVYILGVNDDYSQHPSMTSIWMMSEIFIRRERSSRLQSGARTLLADLPEWPGAPAKHAAVDFYYWYYASLAMYQMDGPDGRNWQAWNQSLIPALVRSQNTTEGECKRGCWEPVDRWSCKGGRVYATAINVLTLEVYYRYQSVFGAGH